MRRHGRVRIAPTLAQDQSGDETSDAGIDMHHCTACEVEHAPIPHQSPVAAPDHMGNRQIDDGEPDRHKPEQRRELHSLGEGADNQRRGNDGKGHLEGSKDRLGDCFRETLACHSAEQNLIQPADEGVDIDGALLHALRRECQAVTVENPEDRHERSNGETLHQDRKDVLGADHSAVEERQTRDGHE